MNKWIDILFIFSLSIVFMVFVYHSHPYIMNFIGVDDPQSTWLEYAPGTIIGIGVLLIFRAPWIRSWQRIKSVFAFDFDLETGSKSLNKDDK